MLKPPPNPSLMVVSVPWVSFETDPYSTISGDRYGLRGWAGELVVVLSAVARLGSAGPRM
jgi:hypothetical protein